MQAYITKIKMIQPNILLNMVPSTVVHYEMDDVNIVTKGRVQGSGLIPFSGANAPLQIAMVLVSL